MNKLDIIKKLGFNPNIIKENDLKKEFIGVIELFLNNFYMDEKIKSEEIYKELDENIQVIDGSKTCNYCRGFNKDNWSYDFICIEDSTNDTYELNIKPTIQTSFNDVNFGENILIKYNLNNSVLEIKRITTDEDKNLVSEHYLYTRSSRNKALVLFSEVKSFDRLFVEGIEYHLHDLKYLYCNGSYKLDSLESKVFITSKMRNNFHILKVNGVDMGMVICDGTILYDYNNNKNKLGDFKVISNNNDDKQLLIVNHIKNYQDYIQKQNLQNKVKGFY